MGLVLSGMVLGGTFVISKHIGHRHLAFSKQTLLDQEGMTAAYYLKSRLGGTRGFQDLGFRIPVSGTDGLISSGAGFYVEPDTDINGNASIGNDRITLYSRYPLPSTVRLANPLTPASTQIDLIATEDVDDTKDIEDLFPPGSLMVVTNGKQSELMQVNGAPNPANSHTGTFIFSAPWWAVTYASGGPATGLTNSYVAGDLVYRAVMSRLGYNPSTKEVVITDTNNFRSSGAAKMKVFYEWDTAGACAGLGITTGISTFSRDDWATINTKPTGYRCVSKIRVDFEGEVESANGEKEKKSYVFSSNI